MLRSDAGITVSGPRPILGNGARLSARGDDTGHCYVIVTSIDFGNHRWDLKVLFLSMNPVSFSSPSGRMFLTRLVPIFVLEWWENSAPEGMKLGTLMSLLLHQNCKFWPQMSQTGQPACQPITQGSRRNIRVGTDHARAKRCSLKATRPLILVRSHLNWVNCWTASQRRHRYCRLFGHTKNLPTHFVVKAFEVPRPKCRVC